MNRTRFVHLILLPATLCVATAQHVTVPLNHQVYPLLIKGETLGLFDSYALRVLPLTRGEAHTLLKQMDEQRRDLSKADEALLQQLLGEFSDPNIGERLPEDGEIHAYRFEEGSTQLFFDVRGIQELEIHRDHVELPDETISRTTAAGNIRGRFGKHLFFGMDARSGMTLGAEDQEERFDVGRGATQVTVGKGVFTDQATGYVTAHAGPMRFSVGRMYFGWGSGLQEQLGLAVLNEPMDQVHFSLDFKRFRFTYVHANLQGIGLQRFLAGHRLDVLLGGGVQIGAYETVVYANRGAELAYLNPLVPYHIIEHQLGDRDNNTFGIDAATILAPGLRAYAEIFLDDFSLDFPLGTYWGNKLAYMAGIHWAQPLQVRELEVFATFTRVDPFVYTHDDSLNVYAHYGASLGSRLGPNAERFHLSLLLRPTRDVTCSFGYDYVRKGKGDLFTAHRSEEGTAKGFLSGILETSHLVGLDLRYQFSRDMFAGLKAAYARRENANLVSQLSAREKTARLYLDINY
ncbi:MAG TPA: hypothetical protein DCP63_12175 [Bacteroidetes bacterium]|nr:hypothetical protein [Bacteroidota bacterium]